MTTEEQAQANDQERRRLVAMRDSFPRNTMNEQWLMFDAEVRKVGPIVADEPDAPTNRDSRPRGMTIHSEPIHDYSGNADPARKAAAAPALAATDARIAARRAAAAARREASK